MFVQRSRLLAVLSANTLLRGAMAASGSSALIGFYLADLARQGRPIDASLVGLLNAAFDVAAILTAVPFGTLIDRYSPRFVLVLGATVGAVATQLFGISGVITIFFVSRILEGAAAAGATSGILAHLTDVAESVQHNRERMRGRIMSYFEISLFAGLALGTLISGPIWDAINTQGFALLAAFYITAAIIFYWGADYSHLHEAKKPITRTSMFAVFADKNLRRLALPWLSFNAIAGMWLTHLAFQLTGPPVAGQWLVGLMTATQVGIAAFVYTVVFATGVLIWGAQIGRIPRVTIMRISFCGMFGVVAAFTLLNISADWNASIRWLVIAGYAVSVLLIGGFPPAALAYLSEVAGKSGGRGTAMGLYTFLLSLGSILGSLLGGFLASKMAVNGLSLVTLLFTFMGIGTLSFLSASKRI